MGGGGGGGGGGRGGGGGGGGGAGGGGRGAGGGGGGGGGRGGPARAASCASVERPGDPAERLPKSLIRHNVAGGQVHAFLRALDAAWDVAAPYAAFGNRQRWAAMCSSLPWPQEGRRRDGEITVPWSTVAPS